MPSHPDRVRRHYDVPDGMVVPYFRDKRASELTRRELIHAYGRVCESLVRERNWTLECCEMDRLFDEARTRMK